MSFGIRICFEFRISTCPQCLFVGSGQYLEANAIATVITLSLSTLHGRQVFGFYLNMTFRSGTKYLSIESNKPNPTANSPNKAKPAWGVIRPACHCEARAGRSLVISTLNGSIVCHIIVPRHVVYGLICFSIHVSYRINGGFQLF